MGLTVNKLNFSYGTRKVLRDISFKVEEGHICAILGLNGSGKTTLIKCLNRLLQPQSGEIKVNNIDILTANRATIAKTFAYLPQSHNSMLPYKVKEVVLMGRAPYVSLFSQPGKQDYKAVDRALEETECSHLKDRVFNTLSGGEKQLVYLTRALIQKAKVLLLDEPTSHLDFRNELLIIEKIKNIIKKENLIAVVALHNPNEVFWLADRVLLINNGIALHYGTPSEVITSSTMENLYGIGVEIVTSNGKKGVIPK